MDTSPLRTCTICRIPKPRSEFHRRTRSRDGLQRHCRACGRQALDAADAARKAQRQQAQVQAAGDRPRRSPAVPALLTMPTMITDVDDLVSVLEARAADVADVLWAVAQAGEPFVLERLEQRLCNPCPEPRDDDYDGPECFLHSLAVVHTNELAARLPAGAHASVFCESRILPPEAAAGDMDSGATPATVGWVGSTPEGPA